MHFEEVGDFDAIDRSHRRATPFGFEGEPAVPGPDIEHAGPRQVFWQTELSPAATENFQAVIAFNSFAGGQFEAVIPALFRDFFAEVFAAQRSLVSATQCSPAAFRSALWSERCGKQA